MDEVHKVVDGTDLVSYLRYRQSLYTDPKTRSELEGVIMHVVNNMRKEGDYGNPAIPTS